jgi:hypothetical protein
MTRRLGVLLGFGVLPMVGVGCGGGSGKGGVCIGLDPCGGDIEGTWAIDSLCIQGDVIASVTASMNMPAACNGALKDFTFENPTGTVSYAGGYESANVTVATSVEMDINSACASALSGTPVTVDATLCSLLQGNLLGSNSPYSGATCTFGSGACQCALQGEEASTDVTGYTVSGHTITYTDGSAPADYCVSGTQLTESQVSPEYGDLKLIAKFHRE